ncbi:MAG: nucleoside-diphosphate kinase [Alphaproteobacteria bacterium]|nr:nucleoside-diphosphate kinase [Alphaproteobacteria bacterium]
MQTTFSMIKPDATAKNVTGAINAMIENAGIRIIAQKRIQMTPTQAGQFYAEHKGKPFYDGLVEMMSSGPIVVQVLQGEDVIKRYRTLMGATNPANAEEGTIRKAFGGELPYNAVHGSDSPESAAREISFFFAQTEIVG